MMGLGNGRRSMKSPPLIMAALVACVIVLGFNYWLASSRSVELQVSCVYRMCGCCVMFKVARQHHGLPVHCQSIPWVPVAHTNGILGPNPLPSPGLLTL